MVASDDLQVPPQVQKVQGVPAWIDFISVTETESEQYQNDPEASCNKAHLLLYLNSWHWNENINEKLMQVSSNSGSGINRKKVAVYKKYNRIAFFADCLWPGWVCAKIMENQQDSLCFFNHMAQGGFGIGWTYILEE